MNKLDLAPIRERLETLKRTSEHPPEAADPLWERPRSLELPITQPTQSPPSQTQQAAVVQALQQRSSQQANTHLDPTTVHTQANPSSVRPHQANQSHYGQPNYSQSTYDEPNDGETSGNPVAVPTEVNLHWQRLQQEAITINELAQKQAIAIQNFKRSADRLAWSLRGHPFEFDQFCELQHPLVSQVIQDEQGRLVLNTATVDLYEDERHASQMADEIRALSQTRSQPIDESPTGFLPLRQPPAGGLETRWQKLTHALETRFHLTPLDIVIWLGGGLISRLALQLLLAAAPSIWPWLVGAMVGAVALALYRLLFTARPDIAFVGRLFLALVGLALGGQL